MMKRSLGLMPPVVALAMGACSPDAPANPVSATAAEVRAPALAVDAEASAALRGALDDARTRVLPTLGDAVAGQRLDQALARAQAALAADDGAELAAALQQVRAEMASARASLDDAGTVVELDALQPLFITLAEAVPTSLRGASATQVF